MQSNTQLMVLVCVCVSVFFFHLAFSRSLFLSSRILSVHVAFHRFYTSFRCDVSLIKLVFLLSFLTFLLWMRTSILDVTFVFGRTKPSIFCCCCCCSQAFVKCERLVILETSKKDINHWRRNTIIMVRQIHISLFSCRNSIFSTTFEWSWERTTHHSSAIQ